VQRGGVLLSFFVVLLPWINPPPHVCVQVDLPIEAFDPDGDSTTFAIMSGNTNGALVLGGVTVTGAFSQVYDDV
jgi:hypothetical protein